MRTLVTGGSGFIGRHLIPKLQHPVVLSRPGSAGRAGLALADEEIYDWTAAGPPPVAAFDGVGTVIHLAGEPLMHGRWSKSKARRVYDSRILGTRHLVATLVQLPKKPRVLIAASAVGYYGDRGAELINESSPDGTDFLADICRAWEAETQPAETAGIRVVRLRIGIVLGRGGGALGTMLPVFRFGFGGRLGSGDQWMPWVHIEDLTNLIVFLKRADDVSGPVNGTAPNPVTNAEFTRELGRVLHRPAVCAVPEFLLHLRFGKLADVLLASQRIEPRVAVRAGFQFQFDTVALALQDLLAE